MPTLASPTPATISLSGTRHADCSPAPVVRAISVICALALVGVLAFAALSGSAIAAAQTLPPLPMQRALAEWLPERNPMRRAAQRARTRAIHEQLAEQANQPVRTSRRPRLPARGLPARKDKRGDRKKNRTAALGTPITAPPSRGRVPETGRKNGRPRPPSAPTQKPLTQPENQAKPAAPAAPPQKPTAEPAAPPPDEWPEDVRRKALAACLRILAPVAAEIGDITPVKKGACGDPAMVEVRAVGARNKVTLQPALKLNCRVVRALRDWLRDTVQPAARELFQSRVVKIVGGGGYSCRNRNGAKTGRLSEHAFGNAIDLPRFVLANGRTVSVLKDWGPTKRDLAKKLLEAKPQPAKSVAPIKLQAPTSVPRSIAPPRATRQSRVEDDGEASGAETARKIPGLPARKPGLAAQRIARRLAEQRRRARERAERRRRADDKRKAAALAKKSKAPRPTAAKSGPARLPRPSSVETAQPPRAKAVVTARARFLRRLHTGACQRFGTVLGPEANEAHRDHFHLDLAKRRRSAYCR